ncbi:MAG: ribosome maturation factor RimM [Burkholderiales bacterium]
MVVMGRVSAPHGVKGWIKVQPFTQDVDGLLGYPQWWLKSGDAWHPHRITEANVHGGSMLIASLEGVESREAAAAMKGAEVAVPRGSLPENREGEFYWRDLLEMEVVNTRGESLGRVEKMMDTGPHTVLVLQGDKELLVPFIEKVILNVDLENRRLVADWELDYGA